MTNLEKYLQAGREAGCPADQMANFARAGIVLQPRQLIASAAARLCDRSAGMTWTNLLRCGATLAAHSWRVGNECRAVLRKYGQL